MSDDPKHRAIIRALILRGLGHLRATMVGWTCAILGAAIIILMISANARLTILFLVEAVFVVGLLTLGWCGGYAVGWLDRELEDDS
jgi:hypothetical protein